MFDNGSDQLAFVSMTLVLLAWLFSFLRGLVDPVRIRGSRKDRGHDRIRNES